MRIGFEAAGWHVQAQSFFLCKRHMHEAIAKESSKSNRHNSILKHIIRLGALSTCLLPNMLQAGSQAEQQL